MFYRMAKDQCSFAKLETIKTSEKSLSVMNRNPSLVAQNFEINFHDQRRHISKTRQFSINFSRMIFESGNQNS